MPESGIALEHAKIVLRILRRVLIGITNIETGVEKIGEDEIPGILELSINNLVQGVKVLDLFLTGNLHSRTGDREQASGLIREGETWRLELSDVCGTTIILERPSAQDIDKRRPFVRMDLNAAMDPDTKKRWTKLNAVDTDPNPDMTMSGEELLKLAALAGETTDL